MGLFSNKNKRDRAAEDSGRFYSKDDDAAIGERARAKRASHAGASAGAARRAGNDPMLPEKKRARRRLVGAIALALAVAIGLPMLLDSEPKQLAGDIAIQIPSKDKAAPLPVPAAPADDDAATPDPSSTAATAAPAASKPAASGTGSTRPKTVAAADSVDQGEEVIDAPPPTPKAPKPEARKSEPKPEHKEPKPEHRDAPKPEHKEAKADKPEHKPEPVKTRLEDKPAKPHEDTRALAILEGKAEARPAESRAESKAEASSGPKSMVQVAAMSNEEKAAEVQAKLRAAGINSTTEKSANGLVRVKIGPYTRDEAEKARAKVARLGL